MHPAMAAPTESPAAAAFFHGAALRDKEEAEVEEGVFSGRFLAARPAVVTQQFMRTTTAVGRCVLAGAAAATAAGAGRWARQASRAKSRRGPRSRSSQYRGVTFYRRTGRWESHIWDCGKQVYLGGFDTAQAAARAYDQAAIKFRGVDADINFSLDNYKEDIKKMSSCSKEDFVQVLRRQGAGFVRGSSRFRGVTLHKCGKWEARIGHLRGKKFVYLGLYDTEMDAAKACDKAAMDSCGEAAVCDGVLGLQSWGSQPDLELTLGCSGGSGGNHSTTVIGGNAAAPGSPRTSLTFELPEDDEEPAVWCTNRKRIIWTGPSSRAIAPLSLALGCPDGDHHPSNMLQMGVVVTDEQGQISGGGRAEEELHMLGWPTGNHCLPYAAAGRIIRIPAGAEAGRRPWRAAAEVEPPLTVRQAAAYRRREMFGTARGSATERLFR